ncbi:MAG: hypothetical protein A2Y57_00300 [Candidatus Woykebacteria bacterium RBG_13_40_7b]|uniref:Uncharacterized protein n=1 Tax=Candidatus Woykebacteria bacterium RBG_13_40_7b TaxID=1802594 RepID=A0A1G1WAF0_9BACT|nr:MAG: hypothetical protein A2Y57_00300 [Candidatus Woykebacteria bacterium RBG_13_40_7b]
MQEAAQTFEEQEEPLFPEGYCPRFYSETSYETLVFSDEFIPVDLEEQEEIEREIFADLKNLGFFDETFSFNLPLSEPLKIQAARAIQIRLLEYDLRAELKEALYNGFYYHIQIPFFIGGVEDYLNGLAKTLIIKYLSELKLPSLFVDTYNQLAYGNQYKKVQAIQEALKGAKGTIERKFGLTQGAPLPVDLFSEIKNLLGGTGQEEPNLINFTPEQEKTIIDGSVKTLVDTFRALGYSSRRIYEVSFEEIEGQLYLKRTTVYPDLKVQPEESLFTILNPKQVVREIQNILVETTHHGENN